MNSEFYYILACFYCLSVYIVLSVCLLVFLIYGFESEINALIHSLKAALVTSQASFAGLYSL